MAREEIEEFMTANRITVESMFIPWSRSRNKGEKQPSLNWKVTIKKDGRHVLTTDYSAGMGHAPSYKHIVSKDVMASVKWECEYGKAARAAGKPILPDACDVLYSLAGDASVLDYSEFENWASDFGYDADSRKAEAIYRACLGTALKLRNGLGEDGLRALQEASQDY
jgi:hypothetical protein